MQAKGNAVTGSASERSIRYLKGVQTELKKVVWPTPKQTLSYTGFVVFMTIVVGAIIMAADTVFNFGLNHFIR